MNGKPSFDCAVIGAGPAGIVAAVYLARFCRRTLLLSDGDSRARWIPRTRNVPAYPEGIGGTELLGRLHEQISRYDVLRENAHVQSIQGESDRFTIQAQAGRWSARRILLATGVRDIIPEELRKLWSLVPEGRVRLCPVCDGFELCGKRIALLSRGAHAVREAHFLRAFSKEVVLLTHGAGHLDDAMRKELSGQGIRWIEAPLQDAQSTPSGLSLTLKARGATTRAICTSTRSSRPRCPASTPRATWCSPCRRSRWPSGRRRSPRARSTSRSACPGEGPQPHQSILTFAALTTFSQRARSSRTCAANSSGVLPTGSMPSVA